MSQKAFREALLRFDSSLDRGLIDQVYERLVKKGEEVVEVGKLVKELTGNPSEEVAANRDVTKRLQ
jgi:Ca2+-binding EF-hand superfamily protein